MLLENKWKDKVDDKIFIYLEKSIERRISKNIKSPYLPTCVSKTILKKRLDKNGSVIFDEIVLSGLSFSRTTAKRDLDKTDCFWFDCFLNLDHDEKLCILIYADPFQEFVSKEEVDKFLNQFKLKPRDYTRILEDSVLKLQRYAEERNLVIVIEDNILRGWIKIAEFWRCSVPHIRKLAVKFELPIVQIEGEVFAFKEKLEEKRKEIMENKNNFVYNKKRTKI